jgi:nucleobase:cation symporter-1, NCS1 family
MAVGAGISIWLFANQTEYIGVIPSHFGNVGDLTFEVGSVLTAVIYLTWRLLADRSARASVAAPAEPSPRV